MKVYLLYYNEPNEGDTILGIFSNLEKLENYYKEYFYDAWLSIDEMTIDAPSSRKFLKILKDENEE